MYVPDQPGAIGSGFEVDPGEVDSQARALGDARDETRNVQHGAEQIAAQRPQLGTCLPALAFGRRLAEVAGTGGLAGELAAATAELDRFHAALAASATAYRRTESDNTVTFRTE
jgi:hypothetical protein